MSSQALGHAIVLFVFMPMPMARRMISSAAFQVDVANGDNSTGNMVKKDLVSPATAANGWNLCTSLRSMVEYHCARFHDPGSGTQDKPCDDGSTWKLQVQCAKRKRSLPHNKYWYLVHVTNPSGFVSAFDTRPAATKPYQAGPVVPKFEGARNTFTIEIGKPWVNDGDDVIAELFNLGRPKKYQFLLAGELLKANSSITLGPDRGMKVIFEATPTAGLKTPEGFVDDGDFLDEPPDEWDADDFADAESGP